MDKNNLIRRTEEFVKRKHAKFSSSHDWWHVTRTRDMALHIASNEGADLPLVELSALLHDVDDRKFTGSAGPTPYSALGWLVSQGVSQLVIDAVVDIISKVPFSKAVPSDELSLEGRCVRDADRLDAIGAIGIARLFTYGGYSRKPIHEPADALSDDDLESRSRESERTSLGHFNRKLLGLAETMATETGRRIAEHRHAVLLEFQKEFHAEWNAFNATSSIG